MVDNQIVANIDKGMALLKDDKIREHIKEIKRTNGSKKAILAFVNMLTDFENCDQEIAELLVKMKKIAGGDGDARTLDRLIGRLQDFRNSRYGSCRSGGAAIEVKTEGKSTVRLILDGVEERLQQEREMRKDVIDC